MLLTEFSLFKKCLSSVIEAFSDVLLYRYISVKEHVLISKKSDNAILDVVVIGAGFAGMYMLHKLREQGLNVLVMDEANEVGGTWYWNRYPGARCDVESMEYSYSFSEELQQEWEWSDRFSTQPEILEYANHVADRFDLRKNIRFGCRVESMVFSEDNNWIIATSSGEIYKSKFCVMATGTLSSVNEPKLEDGPMRRSTLRAKMWGLLVRDLLQYRLYQ